MTTQEPGESHNPFAPSRVLHQAALLEQADTGCRAGQLSAGAH